MMHEIIEHWGVIETIAVIRLIPIVFVFFVALKHRRPLFMLMSGCFGASVIANSFFRNIEWASAFSTISAYTLAIMAVKYIIERKW